MVERYGIHGTFVGMHSNNHIPNEKYLSINSSGEFRGAVDRNAIIDRAVVSIAHPLSNPKMKGKKSGAIVVRTNKPSLSETGFYARCATGIFLPSGNRFQLHYGKASHFRQVPEARISLFSGAVPLSAAQVYSVLHALNANPDLCRVTYAELTFDLSAPPQPEVAARAATRMRERRSFVDHRGWKTLYLGTRQSNRQVCIYQKTAEIVRVEVVCRRNYLRTLRIARPEDVVKLGLIDLKPIVHFMPLDYQAIVRLIENKLAGHWQQRALKYRIELNEPADLLRECENAFHLRREKLLKQDYLNERFLAMQRSLIW